MKATRTRRPCPTCGSPIDRGPGQHAYCSDECRPPICEHPPHATAYAGACRRCATRTGFSLIATANSGRTRGRRNGCASFAGAGVPKGRGRRKHCSRGLSANRLSIQRASPNDGEMSAMRAGLLPTAAHRGGEASAHRHSVVPHLR